MRTLTKDNMRVENNQSPKKTKSPMSTTAKKLIFNPSPKNIGLRKTSHVSLPAKTKFIKHKIMRDKSAPIIKSLPAEVKAAK